MRQIYWHFRELIKLYLWCSLTFWHTGSVFLLCTYPLEKTRKKRLKCSKYRKASTQLKSRHRSLWFRMTLGTRRQAVWLKLSIYAGQCLKWKTPSSGILIGFVCAHALEKLRLKLSLDNEDHVMEGLENSCSWIEFLCFGSSFMCLWTPWSCSDPERRALQGCSWDQRGCFPQCLLLTPSHRSLSSWTRATAGKAALRRIPTAASPRGTRSSGLALAH